MTIKIPNCFNFYDGDNSSMSNVANFKMKLTIKEYCELIIRIVDKQVSEGVVPEETFTNILNGNGCKIKGIILSKEEFLKQTDRVLLKSTSGLVASLNKWVLNSPSDEVIEKKLDYSSAVNHYFATKYSSVGASVGVRDTVMDCSIYEIGVQDVLSVYFYFQIDDNNYLEVECQNRE